LATLAQTGPLSISELSDRLGLDRTTLSRNLRLIEDKGWIAALGHDDQRVRKVALTPKGMRKAAATLAFWKRADANVEPILRRFIGASQLIFFAIKDVYTRMIEKNA